MLSSDPYQPVMAGTNLVASTKQFVWNGMEIAEERDASNVVTRRFYPQGEQIGGVSYFYTRDHLGSVREMTDSTGAVRASYYYDPYGYGLSKAAIWRQASDLPDITTTSPAASASLPTALTIRRSAAGLTAIRLAKKAD